MCRAKARFEEPSSDSGEPSLSRQPVAQGWCEIPSPSKASASDCARVTLLPLGTNVPVLLYDLSAVVRSICFNFDTRVQPTSAENKDRKL